MKEMRNVFEEMMRKGPEEKIEKRGNEKGARRKIFRRKDLSDNKKLDLKSNKCTKEDMRQSQSLEKFFNGIPAEKGRDLSENKGEKPSFTEKKGIKMVKENKKSSGNAKNKLKTLKTIKVGKNKKNEGQNKKNEGPNLNKSVKSVTSECLKAENGVFGTMLRGGRL